MLRYTTYIVCKERKTCILFLIRKLGLITLGLICLELAVMTTPDHGHDSSASMRLRLMVEMSTIEQRGITKET